VTLRPLVRMIPVSQVGARQSIEVAQIGVGQRCAVRIGGSQDEAPSAARVATPTAVAASNTRTTRVATLRISAGVADHHDVTPASRRFTPAKASVLVVRPGRLVPFLSPLVGQGWGAACGNAE